MSTHTPIKAQPDSPMVAHRLRVVACVRAVMVLMSAVILFAALLAGSAVAAGSPVPAWGVSIAGVPSVLPVGAGHQGRFIVIVENTGGTASEPGAVMRDVLPEGLVSREAGAFGCAGEGTREVVCPLGEPVAPGGFEAKYVEFEETGTVAPGSTLSNSVTVSGGGAPVVSAQDSIRAREAGETGPGPGGIADFSVRATDLAGSPVSQAGGHPNLLTTSVMFNTQYAEGVQGPARPAEAIKNLVFYLPLGMLGNPMVAVKCEVGLVEPVQLRSDCPPSSRIGVVLPLVVSAPFGVAHGIYNLVPEKGYAAEFAFASNGFIFVSYASVVRHDGTYMVRVSTPGIPVSSLLIGFVASFYGDIQEHFITNEQEVSFDRGAFLTDPTDCSEGSQAREASVEADTWEHQNSRELPLHRSSMVFPSLTGCGLLGFSADLSVTPETSRADEPSGYGVALRVPQSPNTPTGFATPPVRDTSVTLPQGTTVSPSSANGLLACAATGSHGINIEGGESEVEGPDGLERPVAGHCPLGSRIGTVTASSPLLSEELKGHLFLAEPGCGNASHPNPCGTKDALDGNLYRLYLELEASERGVVVKLAGHASVDPVTGRITATFEDAPQFPFSELTVQTREGPRASLENAQTCGTASTTGMVTSWSPATPPASASSSFNVDWDGSGGACPASSPFAPAFTAGTTNATSGSYSPFTLTLKREDREQNIASVSTTLPSGLLAAVSHVTQCQEPQASVGGCPVSSRVGSTTVAVGPGSDPLWVSGQVFLTGPYGGGPFALSVVVPAVAGPFNLGDVIVRVALHIDADTARVTAVTGLLPQIIDGVPLRIRTINATLDASGFTLNPTSCSPMSITGTVASTQGVNASVSAPFQAHGCRSLGFKPVLRASSSAHTSRNGGAGLKIKVTSAPGQANIGKVDLTLPKQLPSRNSTLQKACTQAQFNTNPAGCPQGSNIGVAKAVTPLLNAALTGPVYLVSHGGAGFPDVVFVLQGEGVRIDLTSHTDITKGITYSHLDTVPDAPVTRFEVVLPQGPHSIFGANLPASAKGSLCGQSLKIPTVLTAQNGVVIKQATKITITGCTKAKTKTKTARHRGRSARKRA